MARIGVFAVVTALMVGPAVRAQAPAEVIGVGMTTYMGGGDATEQLLYKYLGGLKEVDRIFTPRDSAHMFDLLRKLKLMGKRVDWLFLAGHGSAQNPSIEFKDGNLLPSHVDLADLCRQRSQYQEIRARNIKEGRDTVVADEKLAQLAKQIEALRAAGDVMTPGAHVVLLNCSPSATEKGRKFVRDLAHVLLSKSGGTLSASTRDMGIGQVEDLMDLFYANVLRPGSRPLTAPESDTGIGDFWITADWMSLAVPAGASVAGCEDAPRVR